MSFLMLDPSNLGTHTRQWVQELKSQQHFAQNTQPLAKYYLTFSLRHGTKPYFVRTRYSIAWFYLNEI